MDDKKQMWDFLKKSMALGLGIAAITGERVKDFVDQAVAKGDVTRDEAKSMLDDITAKAEEETRTVKSWIGEQVNKALREVGAADSNRVSQLESRIAALERRIERLETASPMAAAGACEEAPTVISE